ncbi:MAG: CCA tRNA nucleotidyltransferase [Parcubacteria group bacterium]|nr:CCA tRNA nucleotidyltransferase [Parcubacteria group bacterium]
MAKIPASKIPDEVRAVSETIESAGFEVYLVGGCVRDLLLEKTPKDWDMTTSAKPEEIEKLFEDTFYENDFGTVGIVNKDTPEESVRVIEVTPYRLESEYSNARHPDKVEFSKNLEDDLKRRDFTINAMAYNLKKGELVDLYKGEEDLKRGSLVAVGDAEERFSEDALRMLRAVRLSAQLSFTIDPDTMGAITKHIDLLAKISKERIRDELIRTIMTTKPIEAFFLMQRLGMLPFVAPDLERGIGVEQNQAHSFDVFEHLLRTMQHGADKGWSFDIRIAGLYHDISKPETRRWGKEKNDWTFHGHEVVGARVAKKAFEELRLPKKQVEKLTKLVRWHMFFSDPEKITLSAARRMIRNVGEENIWDLLNLRICDRIGSGRPKEQPFRFRKYKSMIEEALRDPISVGMLKITGDRIMEITKEKPSKKIGFVLHALLEEVLDDPKLNTEEYLEKRAIELFKLPEKELLELGEKGKERQKAEEEGAVEELRKKYWVS